DRLHAFSSGRNAASAIVGASPVGNLKPGEEKNENDKRTPFEDSFPSHRSHEPRRRNCILEAGLCHSVIVNYNTISHLQALFFENFFDSSFCCARTQHPFDVSDLVTAASARTLHLHFNVCSHM